MKWLSSSRVSRSAGGLRVVAALAFAAAAGCHSLEVTNPNQPDVTRALSSGADVQSLLGGAFGNWYHSLVDVDPTMGIDVGADHLESAWGNWAMRYYGWEPRIYPFVNTHTDPSTWTPVGEEIWYNNYAALVSANLVLKALKNGIFIPGPAPDSSSNPMARAAATFIQGVTMATVAMTYDSGYALDENTDVLTVKLVGRDSVAAFALGKLDAAITLATGGTWSIPENFLNQTGEAWTATKLAQVANTWAARTLAYMPKVNTATASVNWAKVLSYASKGISSGTRFNMEIVGDGPATPNAWWNDHEAYGNDFRLWARVSYRVVCLLDPAYLCHKDNNGIMGPMAQSADWRFSGDGVVGDNCVSPKVLSYTHFTAGQQCTNPAAAAANGYADFIYDALNADWTTFAASRGYWRFSAFGYVRWLNEPNPTDYAVGTFPFVLAAENDLLWAEAAARTGDLATAATKINISRVGRGHLTAAAAGDGLAALLNDIIYERAIELFSTGDRVAWFDARRWAPDLPAATLHYYTVANDSNQTGWGPYGTGLQPGVPHLYPVPAQELTLLGDNIYSFGGVQATATGQAGTPINPEFAVVARGSSGIFGVGSDGRVITGPGVYNKIAAALMADQVKSKRSARSNPM